MKLWSDVYFLKKINPSIRMLCQLSLKFYLGGVIWVVQLSHAFDHNHVFFTTYNCEGS